MLKKSILLFAFFVFVILFAPITMSNSGESEHETIRATESKEQPGHCESKEIEEIFLKMKIATEGLKTCQANIQYLFIQDPELLNSKTLQNGMLYYLKNPDRSYLRIRFDDIKQDDFEPEKRREEYVFDGIWLTRVDYKLKQVDLYQKAHEGSPIDVFLLISNHFPLIGFSNIDSLNEDFDVQLSKNTADNNESIKFLLRVKKGSKYEKEYKKIDFWVATNTYLPVRIVAYSSQGDIHDIKFQDLQINKKLKKAVFTIETPPDFHKNIEKLEDKPSEKGN